MRYADGGGLTVQDTNARQVAWSLRVSTKSVYQCGAPDDPGEAALARTAPWEPCLS